MTEYPLELDDFAVQRYMQGASLAAHAEQRQWIDAGVKAGTKVADIGCGPGAITVLLGRLVEPGGSVVGIDNDPTALATARQFARVSAVENVNFTEGDAAI